MKCDLVCIDKKPQEYRKLFWGDYGNFNRIDFTNFEIFKKIAENSESNTWFINEIDCTKDREGWERLPENAKRMFRLNIVYQTLMDSLVPGIFDKLSDFSTDSWLTYLYSRIFTEEQIHCLREDDEILTDKGWKKLKDLTMDDKVANFYLDEMIVKYENPINIEKQKYKGDVIKIYSKENYFEYIVTPKHRVLFKYENNEWGVEQARYFDPYFKIPFYDENSGEITFSDFGEFDKTLVFYEGNIVGVEVPSTFIIVRFNGKYVAITGNSLSYSSGITQAFGENGSEILDIVYDDEILKKRVETEQKIAYRFIKEVYPLKEPNDNAKKIILELLYRTLLLEGVKFPFSFFVTWNINLQYNNAIQGFSHLLQLIAWDEMTVHTATGVNLINILRKEKDQGFSHLFENGWFSKMVKEVTKEVIDLEMMWIDYLLQEGDIPGFNKEIGEYFVKYWANKRLKEVKEEPLYKGFEKENDIIQWFNNYRNLNNKKVSLQEADNTNYMKGVLKNDILDYEFDK